MGWGSHLPRKNFIAPPELGQAADAVANSVQHDTSVVENGLSLIPKHSENLSSQRYGIMTSSELNFGTSLNSIGVASS